MDQLTAVMLIGGLRRSTLEVAVGCRPACLPIDAERSLFGAWVDRLAAVDCRSLLVVTSEGPGLDDLDAVIDAAAGQAPTLCVERTIEPSSHRGTGGLLRDATASLDAGCGVLLVEPHCAPPETLRPLLRLGGEAPMAVGIATGGASAGAPAGACLVKRELLELAPRIGYHDFKEQFVPLLVGKGIPIKGVALEASGVRVHDLPAYLATIRGWTRASAPSVSASAEVSPSAQVLGHSIVGAEARVGDGAVILDSVVLPGAAVGAGAVVARSVVPRGFRVAPRSLLVDRILDEESSDASDELVALGSGGAA